MSQNLKFEIEKEYQGVRLDKFLAEKFPEYSRAAIQKMIKEKNILLNSQESKSSYKLKKGDAVSINPTYKKTYLTPDSSIKFEVIHDGKDFAVIDKPAGIVVYPGAKHDEKTLVNGLLAKWPEIRGVGDPEYSELRPGIVHRLDKNTSGLMIIAKNNATFEYFKNLFKEKKMEKTYIALVCGKIEQKNGVIDYPIRRSETNPIKQVAVINGNREETREAVTEFKVIKYFFDKSGNRYTLVEATPKTGRMHQLRVHFTALGHPIAGDEIYKLSKNENRPKAKRHLLHAKSLKFILPNGKQLEFFSELPRDFSEFVKSLTVTT